jgi:hypothetical protein
MEAMMQRSLGVLFSAALGLVACAGPDPAAQVFVSPAYDLAWTRERQLCVAAPQAAHCDVYLRNEVPPAPYSADGILIEQRRLCFQTRSIADCTQAQRLGLEVARGPMAADEAPPRLADDEDALAASPASEPEDAPLARRSRRPAATAETNVQCSPAAREALDLAEPSLRAAILRRCAALR